MFYSSLVLKNSSVFTAVHTRALFVEKTILRPWIKDEGTVCDTVPISSLKTEACSIAAAVLH